MTPSGSGRDPAEPRADARPSDRQLLCGLVVASELDLHQHRPAAPGAEPDLVVRLGLPVERKLPVPEGTQVARVDGPDGPSFSVVRAQDDSFLLRFHGACDIQVSADLAEAVVRPALGAPAGIESVLAAGALLAFQLYQRGHLVLHASAVDLGESALAFVGQSGMGKSTMAAVMCAAGARLITDDVLRVDDESGTPLARLGATEIRLRKGARELVQHFEVPPDVRTSADERQVLRLDDRAQDGLPLSAVVIPRPDPDAVAVVLEPVPPKVATLALLGFPRLPGWRDPRVTGRQFAATAAMVARLPVLVARVPWGPPFAADLPAQLTEALQPYLSGSDSTGSRAT